MKKCSVCLQKIPDDSRICPECGEDLIHGRRPTDVVVDPHPGSIPIAPDPDMSLAPIARVSVVDIDIPYASMVGFMVKWALAAIPAILILGAVAFLVVSVLVVLGRR